MHSVEHVERVVSAQHIDLWPPVAKTADVFDGMTGPWILIIDRGDLPSLTAIALEPDRSRVVLWHPRERDPAAPARLAMVRRHAHSLHVADLRIADPIDPGVGDFQPSPALLRSNLLMTGATLAAELGCSKLIWPIEGGLDVEGMTIEVERATLVSTLVDLGSPRNTLAIDLPFIDLDHRQIVELADDSGAHLHEFWPCERAAAGPCGECPGCRTWWGAFDEVGIPWPWAAVPA